MAGVSHEEFLGTELPLIQAPMAGVQDSALALAVSSAGGLGSLPCAMLDTETLRAELAAMRSATDRPVNVNFFCHKAPKPDPERESRWRKLLEPYLDEYGISIEDIPAGPARVPFGHEMADVLEEFRPPIVSFHFGLPGSDLVARVKAWGATVLASATTVEEARWLETQGADGIIAQGLEAGGHRGMFLSMDLTTQMGTLALVPQIVRHVTVPVIAAGGIADAQVVAAALSLGATAVQVGTAYLLCPETKTTSLHRAALKSDAARHTAVTNLFSGRPARGIVNRVIREIGPISGTAPEFPLAAAAISALRQRAEARGSADFSPLWSGQNASGCREIPAAELTRALAGRL
ncbi:MAG: 2-nitropropane dioxygenase [Gammaproteobacteria bacterium SG8_31]|jgi:nitronate monooxygenase|nr:MAG: 2-nitropropane dioxygenase [Gammaproteobacteria bacterium SG8_31]